MFSSITSYLWGAAEEEEATTTPENTTQETETAAAPPTPSPKSRRRALKTKPAENEWVLVETSSCESPDGMESNPLENLLIEHPSMSVYGPRGRQNSDGDESVGSESEEEAMAEEAIAEEPSPAVRGRPMTATVRHPPRRAHAVAARAGLVAQTVRAQRTSQRVKHRVEMRNNRRNALHRHNKTIVVRSGPSPHVKPRVVCQPSARSNTRC